MRFRYGSSSYWPTWHWTNHLASLSGTCLAVWADCPLHLPQRLVVRIQWQWASSSLFSISHSNKMLLSTDPKLCWAAAAAAAKSLQSCPTLCGPMHSSPPGSPVPGILQARTLEWAAISFSNAWKWKVIVKSLSHVWLLATPWTAAHQAPPSMGFSRQEYWSGVQLPSPSYVERKV